MEKKDLYIVASLEDFFNNFLFQYAFTAGFKQLIKKKGDGSNSQS